MRYSLLNTTPLTYLQLWEKIRDSDILIDIPPTHIPEEWLYQLLDNATNLDDQAGEVSELYDIMTTPVKHLLGKQDTVVTVSLSTNSVHHLHIGNDIIRFPLIWYSVDIKIR